jgi:Ser/Thr protein kinase RdoA (MazF antagonist)
MDKSLAKNNFLIKRTRHGVDNRVYFLTNKNNKKLGVLKLYNKRSLKEVLHIKKTMEFLARKKVPVQKIKKFLIKEKKPALFMEYIEGRHSTLSSNKKIRESAYLMASFHNLRIPNFLEDKKITDKDYKKLFKACSDWEKINKIQMVYNAISMDYLGFLPKGVVHGDFSCSNILFNKNDKILGLLDCDHCCLSYFLTDLARAQIFFSFDKKNRLNKKKIKNFIKYYNNKRLLEKKEKENFLSHLRLVLIKMILETYYYVEVIKEVKFMSTKYNQSYNNLYEKMENLREADIIDIFV